MWYLLHEDGPRTGPENMAIDSHLLELQEEGILNRPILRVYSWQPATLSLGYHQRWRRTVVPDALREHQVDLVRRWTGGRAVLHAHEITYAVIAPQTQPFSGRITHNYRQIGEALQRFTQIPGAVARMAEESSQLAQGERLGSLPCFASLSSDEIETGGRKMIGSAQKVGRRAFLQHGSIPLSDHGELLQKLTGTSLSMDHYMTNLGDHYQEAGTIMPSQRRLEADLVAAFAAQFAVTFTPLAEAGFPNPERVSSLVEDVFNNETFTFRK